MKYRKYYWLNDESIQFLRRGYIPDNQTPQERIREMADAAESYLGIKGFSDKFEDYAARGFYSFSTPVWVNFGKNKGLPISCYGSNIDDSLDSILNCGREIGMMSKFGGGTSAYLGNIRPLGSPITTGGFADGPVHYAKMYDTIIDVCKQAEARRGACAIWLPIEHNDISDFLDIGTEGNPIQNLQYGVTVSTEWLNEMRNPDNIDTKKRKIWAKIIQRRNETGFPYIMFKDNSNNDTSPYKKLGLEITASNLCMAPETAVDIKLNGESKTIPIILLDCIFQYNMYKTLEVKSYNIETGESEYKEVINSAMTSTKAKVLKITDSVTGKSITCTPDHKVYTKNRGYVMAKELKSNDNLLIIDKNTDSELIFDFIKEEIPVFDITVKDNHNFYADDILVHNCSEIQLPTDSDNSFVCCLGSMNLLHWDEIVETDAIELYTMFLNAVMDEFIHKSSNMPGMKRAWRFAYNHRAIGLGVLGYHSYLQSKLLPFESLGAKSFNHRVFKILKERSDKASQELFQHNEVKYKCIRPGFANTTLLAIAPTKSSSFILGQVSMGIEPIKSNYFIKDLAKIKTIYKNPYLTAELKKYDMDKPEIWESILRKDGSVQHLDFPTREVFKTFLEITPKEIILQAAQRQQYIDQSQSLNLMIHPSIPAKDINQLYLYAHDAGVKTLYYQFSQNSSQVFSRNILECVSCEG